LDDSLASKMKLPDISKRRDVQDLIARAVAEDIGCCDVTSVALVPVKVSAKAVIIARDNYIVSGAKVAETVFRMVDRRINCVIKVKDGRRVRKGQTIMIINGSARSILTAERTALNFMQRMTGIATLTARFAAKVRRHGTMILDTRKTTPTLRGLEKYAVLSGGGRNHRMGLHDMALIKDNHRALWGRELGGAVATIRKRFPKVKIEVEVENERQLESALKARPEWVLLDNMTPQRMRKCVRICRGRALLEASGGITLKNVERVAATGVDAISLGCLTHSAAAADLSLEMIR
jgi:nicotinate-nucleotide pyrophosphorylase (carboxylating)